MQPILRWAGSKRQLLPKLKTFWKESFRTYIEPFCGSACLFFDLEPCHAVLGDLNPELIVTYRTLQRDPELVTQCLMRLPIGKEEYYQIRSQDSGGLSDAQLAARFLYLNRFCFNGIFRTNRKGKFNVPYGRQSTQPKHNVDLILRGAKVLQNATLVSDDFESTLGRAERGDFVYLDPPYAVSKRRIFAEYHPDTFSVKDLERLSSSLERLDKRGVSFVVSYADSREARRLLAPWNPKRVLTRRNVAGFAAHRKSAYEILASNMKQSYVS